MNQHVISHSKALNAGGDSHGKAAEGLGFKGAESRSNKPIGLYSRLLHETWHGLRGFCSEGQMLSRRLLCSGLCSCSSYCFCYSYDFCYNHNNNYYTPPNATINAEPQPRDAKTTPRILQQNSTCMYRVQIGKGSQRRNLHVSLSGLSSELRRSANDFKVSRSEGFGFPLSRVCSKGVFVQRRPLSLF